MARWNGNLNDLTPKQIDAICARARLDVSTLEQGKKAEEAQTGGRAARRSAKALPPLANRGVTGEARTVTLKLRDGEIVEIPARRGWDGKAGFIDFLTFTCHESSFSIRQQGVSDREVVTEASFVLAWIFGYGITCERKGGKFFYERSFILGDNCGDVCHGGQRDTVCVNVTGTGLAAAKPGWEGRLYWFLNEAAVSAKITRIDLAYDDFDGLHTVDQMRDWYMDGAFDSRGPSPDSHKGGNWDKPNGKGRTFYVGNRDSGKLFRGYEKGKQLGDKDSNWFRFEGELRAKHRELPFDMLLNAGAYLAGMYPCLAFLNEEQCQVKTYKKVAEATYQKSVDWLKKQVGGYLWLVSEIEGGAEAMLKLIGRPGDIPKALNLPDWRFVGRCYHDADIPDTLIGV